MTFDKSKVYTALNADELRVGSRCIFADTIQDLKKSVERSVGYERTKLKRLQDDTNTCRFIDSFGKMFVFAYLIEPPAEPKYKPFSSVEKAREAIDKHGGWVKRIDEDYLLLTTGVANENIILGNGYYCTWEFLFNEFAFIDGTPCGELVEE